MRTKYKRNCYQGLTPEEGSLARQMHEGDWKLYTLREISTMLGADYTQTKNVASYLRLWYGEDLEYSAYTLDMPLDLTRSAKPNKCYACRHYDLRAKCCKLLLTSGKRHSPVDKDVGGCADFERAGKKYFEDGSLQESLFYDGNLTESSNTITV